MTSNGLWEPVMKRIIVQIYEIQEPREAERLIEMGWIASGA